MGSGFKSNVLKALLSSALALFSAFLLLKLLGAGFSGVLSGFDEHFYMQFFYDIHNREAKSVRESPDITVIDISDIQTRSGLADLIDSVIRYQPAVIGLDVFMRENPDVKDDADNRVIRSLSKAGCAVVSPCIYDEISGSWQYPFYKDVLDSANFLYASPVAFDVNEEYSGTDPRADCSTSAYEIARVFSSVSGCDLVDWNRRSINYRNKDFFPLDGKDILDRSLIEGKIVLIGDCHSFNDIRTLPFKVMASNRLPSVINIAYTLNSLISSKQYCDKQGYGFVRRMYNCPFVRCSSAISLALSYFLCFLFALAFFSLGGYGVTGSRRKGVAAILMTFILSVGMKFLMILACIELLTSVFLVVPDILLYVTSMLFVDSAIEVVKILTFDKA